MRITPILEGENSAKPRLNRYQIRMADGRSVEFEGSAYIKQGADDVVNQMREINKYLAFLVEKHPKRVEMIFQGYLAVRKALTEIVEPQVLLEALRRAVKLMYEPIIMDEIISFVRTPGWVKIPPNLDTQLTGDNTAEKTYLRDEYIDLTGLAVWLRPMVPIWGEYMPHAGTSFSTLLKEDMALSLLNYTDLRHFRAYEKLEEYIRAQVPMDRQTLAMSLDWMSSEKVPSWMRSQALVRRVATRDLDKVVETTVQNGVVVNSSHLISLVYSYTVMLISDRRFHGPVRQKRARGNSSNEEENQSIFEIVMVKSQRSPRVINLDSAFVKQVGTTAKSIEVDVPDGLAESILENMIAREDARRDRSAHMGRPYIPSIIPQSAKYLAAWVLSFKLAHRSIPKMPRQQQYQCIAATAAILLTWGFPELAAMVAGVPMEREESYQLLNPFTATEIQLIFSLYHHALAEETTTNLPLQGIDMVAKEFAQYEWQVGIMGKETLARLSVNRKGVMPCPGNIRSLLVNLTAKLNQHVKIMKETSHARS